MVFSASRYYATERLVSTGGERDSKHTCDACWILHLHGIQSAGYGRAQMYGRARTDGPDVRTVPDVAIAASDAAHAHGGALHVAHVQDPSSMTQSSPSVAAATLGTDVRSRPRVNQPGP